ncbi:MAG: hypothetical protein ACFFED_08230 [Candidatus Thorarchaeota archaeon]
MGCKAEGAAQGYTVLGGIVLLVYSLNMLITSVNGVIGGDLNALVDFVLGIALLLMTILSFDACGFVYWKVHRSGPLLALFGLIAIFIVGRGISFDILGWIMNLGTLAGFMIVLAGLLLIFKG